MSTTIILIGGGHAHALFLRAWAENPVPGVTLHVFDPQPRVAYTGMLPGFVAGHYSREELSIDLLALTEAAGGIFHAARVEAIDPNAKTIQVADKTLAYDIASIDVGIHTGLRVVAGAPEHALGVKPLTEFAARWQEFLTEPVETLQQSRLAVIGGGVAGVEVTLAMAHRLRRITSEQPTITLIERGELLREVSPRARRHLQKPCANTGSRCVSTQAWSRLPTQRYTSRQRNPPERSHPPRHRPAAVPVDQRQPPPHPSWLHRD